jgi:hypothetical protein
MKLLLCAFLLFLIIFSPAISQQAFIDLSLFNTNARVFYVGDLDPTGLGNAPNYFILRFGNLSGADLDVKILFKLITTGVVLVEGESNVFRLPASGNFAFTNNQLNTGVAIVDGQEVKIKNYSVDFDQLENLNKQVTSTGKLPAGRYEFNVELEIGPPAGTLIPDQNPDDNILIISNPTTIELLYPGTRVGTGPAPEIPTTAPYFIWQSDADLFNFYLYRVYESGSIQDVLSRDPVVKLINVPVQFFQYPPESQPLVFFGPNGSIVGGSEGAVRQILSGHTYYWYVEAVIGAASGTPIILRSDVNQFAVVDRENTEMNADLIPPYLRQLLGEKYDDYMQNLENYSPTGKIMINGTEVELEVLIDLIEDLLAGKIIIENVFIEN